MLDLILSRNVVVGNARGGASRGDNPPVFRVSFSLEPDEARQVQDPRDTRGLILTGKWLQDYATLIRLQPEYEAAIAAYKTQATLHEQVESAYADALVVKDKKDTVLKEMLTAQENRAILYKTMADIERESWLDRFFHKIAFPAGVTIGLFVGSYVARH